jgi:hypothetical protein
MIKKYRNADTGVLYNRSEILKEYEDFRHESQYMSNFENFADYLDTFEEIEIKSGESTTFKYDGISFLITVIDNFCECYAESQYQFGFELGQDGFTESMDDLTEMLINNYENGNIFIEE